MKQSKGKTDKRVDRVHSKNPLTVDKFLSGSDVSELLEEIHDNRAEITDLFCIYRTDDGTIQWRGTPETKESMAIYLMEQVKYGLLQGDNDDD
jgi:hypothetical protein